MESLRLTIDKVFKGAGKSFYRFPAAIISAIIISITAMVRITMEWDVQRSYSLLFNSIQMAFVFGGVFSMAAVMLDEVKTDKKKSFFLPANIAGIIVASISFLLLYFYGGIIAEDRGVYLSNIAIARVGVGIFISAVAFIYIMSKSERMNRFSDSFFITHRAFVVSTIYGLVIMLGVSGVLGAFQALVYRGMDYRVYQYLGVVVGFLTYTIFLGYFPDFRQVDNKVEIESITEQPRFIVVLFDYILVPIMLALTVVLLIWSARVILNGMDVSFERLSGIATSYVIIGIWLHIMVAKYDTKIGRFYKKIYPLAGILILLFEAWALFGQISTFGLKTSEYSFLMIWIFAVISVLLLIFLKEEAYRKIAIVATVISIIWVLPVIGYEDITFKSQVNRLEEILTAEGFLANDHIMAKDGDVDHDIRVEITGIVDFISRSEKVNTPNWFEKNLNEGEVFRNIFGFKKTYGLYSDDLQYGSINMRLVSQTIDIRDYSLSLNRSVHEMTDHFNEFEGAKGTYGIMISNEAKGIPKITVKLEERIIIEEDMSQYLSDFKDQYLAEGNSDVEGTFEEMSLILEGEGISILLVFENISAYFDRVNDTTDYYAEFQGIYIRDK